MAEKYKGELLKGRSHSEGGIQVKVRNSRMVEMEGGEGVINKRSMASAKKFNFQGNKMTTCEIVSELNQKKGDGVAFDCDSVEGRSYILAKGGQIKENSIKLFLPY